MALLMAPMKCLGAHTYSTFLSRVVQRFLVLFPAFALVSLFIVADLYKYVASQDHLYAQLELNENERAIKNNAAYL